MSLQLGMIYFLFVKGANIMKQVQEVVMFKIDKSDDTSIGIVKEVYNMIGYGDLQQVLVDKDDPASLVHSQLQTELIPDLNGSVTFCVRMTTTKESHMNAVVGFIQRMITRRLNMVSLDEYRVSDFIITDYDEVILNEGE